DTLAVGQTFTSWDELDLEEQSLDVKVYNQNSFEMVDTPVVGQTFTSWDELDCFISFYTISQNFVNMIRGSEYNNG
ncbi:31416_t:CDS:2, partial [Racocetra persica]